MSYVRIVRLFNFLYKNPDYINIFANYNFNDCNFILRFDTLKKRL
jgi:hypothetical protein